MAADAEHSDASLPRATTGLSAKERQVLAFERRHWRDEGAKAEAIRAELDLSAARYYQVLNALLDSRAALVSDPMLVKRLRRVRDARTHARSARIVADVSQGTSRET